MRKEIIVAVATGSILGMIIAFFVWRGGKHEATSNPSTTSSFLSDDTPTPTSTSTPQPDGLLITSPQTNAVLTESPTEVVGLATGAELIIVSGEKSDSLILPELSGAYLANMSLIPSINRLRVFGLYKNEIKEKTVNVVFSAEFSKIIADTSASPSPTPKSTTKQTNPTAMTGSITDILESGLQIKTELGQIGQISVDKAKVQIVKVGTSGNKDAKFTDLAIGDNIIAMGFVTTTNTMDAKRILISTLPSEDTRKVLVGTVKKVTSNSLTITNLKDAAEWTVKIVATTDNPKISTIEVGQKVVVSGTAEDSVITARIVHLIITPSVSPSPSATPQASPSATPKPTKNPNLQ